MPLETQPINSDERLALLNARYTHQASIPVLQRALFDPLIGSIAMVSSFGAESVVLLHMVASTDPTLPVLFLDTEMHFPQTLAYQRDLARDLGLTDVRHIKPDNNAISSNDPHGTLHQTDPTACCTLRKKEPLNRALAGYDTWITGRKRFQGNTRTDLNVFETDGPDRIKINPLTHWRHADILAYITDNALPKHPLLDQGYPSIGCAPCTSKVTTGEDIRAGRWRGETKTECGIHFDENGTIQRTKVTNT